MYSLSALRYTAAAARLKSFSAAARECGVSQPTVSAAVSELETALGTPLFLRGRRQLEVSMSGARLLTKITEVLGAVEALHLETVELASTARSELRIGFTPLAGAGRVALLLDPHKRQYPEARMIFFESSVGDLERRLDAGQLDIIIGCGFRKSRSHKKLRLFRDPIVLCTRDLHRGSRHVIDLEDASKTRLLLTQDMCGLATYTRALFKSAGLKIDVYPGLAMSYGALEDWVELGLGSAVIPQFHLRNSSLARSLVGASGQPVMLDLVAMWRSSLATAEHAAKFLTYLHRVVPTLARGLAQPG